MKSTTKKIGIVAITALLTVSGVLLALPSHSFEKDYYDAQGNYIGQESYYCGRSVIRWGDTSGSNFIYYDLGPC